MYLMGKRFLSFNRQSSDIVSGSADKIMERLVKLEKDVEYLKKGQESIHETIEKLHKTVGNFVEKADSRYVHVDEFKSFKEHMTSINNSQQDLNKWNRDAIIDLIKQVAVGSILVAILAKQFGWM